MRDKKLIQFYLTTKCNSCCKTCKIWQNSYKNVQELPYDLVSRICIDNRDSDFVLGGGEFTVYSQKHKLLDVLDDAYINYTVLSNAVSLVLLEDVIKRHNIQNLTMSCDGKNHDSIRGVVGNLWNIVHIISKYRKKIPNIKLSYTYSSLNENTFDEDMDFIKNVLGFDKVYFCIAQDMDLLKTGTKSVIPKDLEKVLKRKDMLYDKDVAYIESILNGEKKKCDSTNSVFTVYSNGDIVRCQSFMSKDVLGNIYKDNFNSVINKTKENSFSCMYDKECNLLCQRRYD